MKRIFVSAVIALALLAGCEKEKPVEQQPQQPQTTEITTITAKAPGEDADTNLKLLLEGTAKNEVRWRTGDKIYVAQVSGTSIQSGTIRTFTASAVTNDGKNATFTLESGAALTAGTAYMAFHVGNYDAERTRVISGALQHSPLGTTTNPLTQQMAGMFADGDAELFFPAGQATATHAGTVFSFRHVMALIEIEIWTDEPEKFTSGFAIDRVSVQARGGISTFLRQANVNAAGVVSAAQATGQLDISLRDGAGGRYMLGKTPLKVRIPAMLNIPSGTATTSTPFNVYLYPTTGPYLYFARSSFVQIR